MVDPNITFAGVSNDVNSEHNPDTVEPSEVLSTDILRYLSVGCLVEDIGKFYLLYCQYAHGVGFSVRRGDQKYVGKTGEIRWKDFVCSAAGMPDGKRSSVVVPCYRKMITRTGCKAKIRVQRVPGGPLMVSIFETAHNHPLVPPDQTYLLRSARAVSHAQKSVLEALNSVGIGVSQACGFMEKEAGGHRNLGFVRQDAYDYISRQKRATKVPNADSRSMLKYFDKKYMEDPCFFHKTEVDDDGRLMNFFFRDSRCADDYEAFGDVISVDTTYRTNRYNLICAPFTGINHHGKNVMFGLAFLSDETAETFEWLFNSFLSAMHGKEPKAIFTDQCQSMMNAIDSSFPNSTHRLCQWHINQNAPSHFGSLNGDTAFKRLWHKCMNGVVSEDEFEDVWSDMINGYVLGNNKWFCTMYSLRHRWASVYSNGTFTAGLLATSRSEATNRALKKIVTCSGSLYDCITSYEIIQERWREKERVEDTMCMNEPGQFVRNNPLLSHAAKVYTRNVFKSFEFEVANSLNVELCQQENDIGEFQLQFKAMSVDSSEEGFTVIYNRKTHHASCSCHKLENEGILCRHILKVFYINNVRSIPEDLILKRWTKGAKVIPNITCASSAGGELIPYIFFVNNIMRSVSRLVSLGKDDLSARQLLETHIDNARHDIYAKIGNPDATLNPPVRRPNNDVEFKDPAIVRSRGFHNTRASRQVGAARPKFKKKKPQRPTGLKCNFVF